MFYNDHSPPRSDGRYGQFEATIEIETLETLEGYLPSRALNLIRDWAIIP
jgi:hypothetical protein